MKVMQKTAGAAHMEIGWVGVNISRRQGILQHKIPEKLSSHLVVETGA